MKRGPLLISIGVFILLTLGGLLLLRSKKKEPSLPPESAETEVETALEERPYVSLTPSADGHWLTLKVSHIKDASDIEYELLYKTESGAMQGSLSSFSLKGETIYSKKILLGSESSGHYKYDEGVSEGSLTIRLRGGKGTRKFVSDFHLQKGAGPLTTIDGNFELEGKLPDGYFITMSCIGLPSETPKKVIAGPYAVFSSGKNTLKSGKIKISLGTLPPQVKLYLWNGNEWMEPAEPPEIEDGRLVASVSSLTTFIITEQTQ